MKYMDPIIKKDEVLRYLGYRNQELDDITKQLIEESIKETIDLMEAKHIHKTFPLRREGDDIYLEGTNLNLLGQDIKRLLAQSGSCVLMAVTLGHRIDKAIRYYEKINMAKALVMDACASAAIEEVCNQVNQQIREDLVKEDKHLTRRYCPGYGDFPLDLQGPLLEVLEAKKRIGLNVTSHNILIPRKSVTAIIGIMDKEEKQEETNCKDCNKYSSCNYRKGDVGCGNYGKIKERYSNI